MKTSIVINLLCTSISGSLDGLNLLEGLSSRIDDGKILHDEIEDSLYSRSYTHVNSIIGSNSELVRELWKELPESVQTEEGTKLTHNFYPHLFKDENKVYDFAAMIESARELHRIIYAIWQDLDDARRKFDLS